MFLLLTHQSSSHGHGLCVLVFPFQHSHLHCLTLLLDLELSFSLTHTMGMGTFGKGLSLMWDTHPHPAPESCTHRSFSDRIPEQEKDCGPFPRTAAHFQGLWPISMDCGPFPSPVPQSSTGCGAAEASHCQLNPKLCTFHGPGLLERPGF